jgi:hypothetical protein
MIETHEEETMEETKMQLWNAVCTTDPAHAKQVDARGGYTAISAQYQFQLATEQFGPYGKGWGVKELRYEFVDPSSKEMVLDAIFYFPGGEFEIGTDIVYRAGNDSRKKLLTDLTTKALSKLGFNADVFMGKFDDNKYINSISTEKLQKERFSILYSLERRFDDKSDDREAAYEEYSNMQPSEIEDSIEFFEKVERKDNAILYVSKLFEKQKKAKSVIDGQMHPLDTKEGLREILKSVSKKYGMIEEVTTMFKDRVMELEKVIVED